MTIYSPIVSGSLNVAGNIVVSGSSDSLLDLVADSQGPWTFRMFNTTFSSSAALEGFIWDTGRASIGTEIDNTIELSTNNTYDNPQLVISSSFVKVDNVPLIIRSGSINTQISSDGASFVNGILQIYSDGHVDIAETIDLYPDGHASFASNLFQIANDGKLYIGSSAIGNATPVPLNLNNTGTSGNVETQINLINTAGGGGTGTAIDSYTYTGVGNGVPGGRIQFSDDSNYSNNFSILLKIPGNDGNNDLGTSWIFDSSGVLRFPDNSTQSTGVQPLIGRTSGIISSPTSSGTGETWLGEGAGSNSGNINQTVFIGYHAGDSTTGNAQKGNFIGYYAGNNATDAYNANFIGVNAGDGAFRANKSNFIGHRAGNNATDAYHSTFIGRYTGTNASNADTSVFIGHYAGYGAANAKHSIFIGDRAGQNDGVDNRATDYSSIAIGDNSSPGGHPNSIALGKSAVNTATNQFLLSSGITQLVFPLNGQTSSYVLTSDGTKADWQPVPTSSNTLSQILGYGNTTSGNNIIISENDSVYAADYNTDYSNPTSKFIIRGSNATIGSTSQGGGDIVVQGGASYTGEGQTAGDVILRGGLNNYEPGSLYGGYVRIFTSGSERVTIDSVNGYVGFNNIAPTEVIDVIGNVKATSFIGTSSYTIQSLSSSYSLYTDSASYSNTAISSSYASTVTTAPYYTPTSSFNSFTSSYSTGSFTGSFKGSFTGTSSYSNQALSASYYGGSVISSSYASTASYVKNAISSSYSATASVAPLYVLTSATASMTVLSSSYASTALSASYVPSVPTFPYTGSAIISGSLSITGSILMSSTSNINLGSDTTGDTYYRSAGGVFSRLGIGSTGQLLTVSGGLPSWNTLSGTLSGLTSGQVSFANSSASISGSTFFLWNDTTKRLGVGNNASTNAAALGVDVSSYGTDGYALRVIQSSNTYPAAYFNNNGGGGDTLQLVGIGSATNYFTDTGTIGLGSRDTAKSIYLNRGLSVSAPGLNGMNLVTGTNSFTDTANVSSATNFAINVFNIPTIVNTGFAGTTQYTNSYNLYINGGPVAGSNAAITNSYALGIGSGNVVFGTGFNTNANFLVAQPTTGVGNIVITSGSINASGSSTQYTNTFKSADTLIANGTTYTISAIVSDASMSLSPTPTASFTGAYTLTGGARFNVYGNGNVTFGSTSTMWYDSRYGALNIGTSTSQSTYLLNVNGAVAHGALTLTSTTTSIISNTQTVNSSGFNSSALTLNANYVLAGGVATLTNATTTGLGAGTYTGISPTGGTGTGLVVTITVTGTTSAAPTVTTAGSGYLVGDVITVNKTSLGGSSGTVSFFISSVTSSNSNSVNNSPYAINNYPIDYNGTSTPMQSFGLRRRSDNSYMSDPSGVFTISQRYFSSNGATVTDFSNGSGTKLMGFQHNGSQVLLPVGISVSAASTFNGNTVTMGALTTTTIASTASQTTVTVGTGGSTITSGSVIFSQPFIGSSYKKVIIYCNAAIGVANYTFPTVFINTPVVLMTNGLATTIVTSLSTTTVSVTCTTTTGILIIEGY